MSKVLMMGDLHKAAQAMRDESFSTTPQITLGELYDSLKDIPTKWSSSEDDVHIKFDFGTAYPTGFSSWRGSYSEIAINYGLGGYDNNNADQFAHTKLSDFVVMLKKAIGQEYEGWKGGEFIMTRKTPVWVANDGNVGNTGVVGILNNDYEVIILTQYCEY